MALLGSAGSEFWPDKMPGGTTESGKYGRNSHVSACTECRARKAKCSKSRPTCVQCRQANKKCVYPEKVVRTPLTRQHLTAVETRLGILETALSKLFPNGDINHVTRRLLEDDLSQEFELPASADELASVEHPSRTENVLDNAFDDLLQQLSQGGSETTTSATELQQLEQIPVLGGLSPSPRIFASSQDERAFLNAYFQQYHSLNPIVHEPVFRAEYDRSISPANETAWPILANMILAIGAWMHSDDTNNVEAMYYEQAKRYMQTVHMLNSGNITLVQALVLLSDFAQRQGSPEESWQYVGTATRIAISLNLHIEPTELDLNLSPLDKEIRRRIWWMVYCSESCSAKIYGRPLLLPEDRLITVKPVSSIPEMVSNLGEPLPSIADSPTIYSGLIQQSSYHRMANVLYRHLLSSTIVTAQDIRNLEETIDHWHISSSFCTQHANLHSVPDWYLVARDKQALCDRSLRLLIHRPLLLQWLARKRLGASDEEQSGEVSCLAHGLNIARTTIDVICGMISDGQYSKLTLPFMLYALFHALLVPVIHLKATPSSVESISCVQSIEKVKGVLNYLPVGKDKLSIHFYVILGRLCSLTSQGNEVDGVESHPEMVKPDNLRMPSNNIFGNEEMALLDSGILKMQSDVDLADWLHCPPTMCG